MFSESVDSVTITAEEAGTDVAIQPLQRAYDRIIRGIASGRQQMVFDEFWREGELAFMFGAPGTGKSLLAVRIANALASGGDLPWFQMDTEAANTLYVDLSMSDRQFAARYIYLGHDGDEEVQPMSERLFCDRPADDGDLIGWLAERIEAEKLKYVIIDDLSAVMNTCDGTRDTMAVMSGLRGLRERFDVSILVVMQSDEPRAGAALSERDLGRQRSLCRLADSAFGIGRNQGNSGKIYLMQTRSRNSALVWTGTNRVYGMISEWGGGSGRINFELRISAEDARLIKAIRKYREEGLTYRQIATKLRISKSRADRLDKRPAEIERYEREFTQEEYDDDEWDYEDDDRGDEDLEVEPDVRTLQTSTPPHSGGLLHSEPTLDVTPLLTRGLGHSLGLSHSALHGPWACPFLYDGSGEAKRWEKFLFAQFPDKSPREIIKAYRAGDEWCRPPGAVPPRDPEDPLGGLEIDVDILGNRKYVEERFYDGSPSIYYAYRPDGKLYRFAGDRMALANANLFGKFADVGKDGVPRGHP